MQAGLLSLLPSSGIHKVTLQRGMINGTDSNTGVKRRMSALTRVQQRHYKVTLQRGMSRA
jgi:hypothetical protein